MSLCHSKTIFHLCPYFRISVIHLKLAFVGMEVIIAGGEFDLVVQGIGCREAVENAAIGYVNIGKATQL